MVQIEHMGSKEREGSRADRSERLNNEQNQTVWLTGSTRIKHIYLNCI